VESGHYMPRVHQVSFEVESDIDQPPTPGAAIIRARKLLRPLGLTLLLSRHLNLVQSE
jgi:hypothetical protein